MELTRSLLTFVLVPLTLDLPRFPAASLSTHSPSEAASAPPVRQ